MADSDAWWQFSRNQLTKLTLLALIVRTMAVLALFLALSAALITVVAGAVLAIGAIVSAIVHGRLRRFR